MPSARTLRLRSARPSSRLLMVFLSASLLSLSVAYHIPADTKGVNTAELGTSLSNCNVSNRLVISRNLMEAAEKSLNQFQVSIQKTFTCSLESIGITDPKNEEKILKACMERKSMGESFPCAANNVVNQTCCENTIYQILKDNVMKMKDFMPQDLLNISINMLKDLNINLKMPEQILPSLQRPLNEDFVVQMKQCKMFLIFQQLTQTIDRTLCYRKSVEF